MDHCFPFGAKNAHNRLGITVDAVIDILKVVRISPIPKWADDLFPIRFPIGSTICADGSTSYQYPYDLTALKDAVAPLCIPWHSTKWNKFSSTPVYLGLVWNFNNHTISLAEPKRLKYLTKVSDFLRDHSTSQEACHESAQNPLSCHHCSSRWQILFECSICFHFNFLK